MASYTVFNEEGPPFRGGASEILEELRAQSARNNAEIDGMNVDQYADAIIEDARYFLPDDLLDAINEEKFDSKHDKALMLLDKMPTSGVHILTVAAASHP